MTGFEPPTSDVGSDRSTNCATTTSLISLLPKLDSDECALQNLLNAFFGTKVNRSNQPLSFQAMWPVKSCPKEISLAKWKILTTLQKLPKKCGRFGQNNCCNRLWKVAQSAINGPIWSHWLCLSNSFYPLIALSAAALTK